MFTPVKFSAIPVKRMWGGHVLKSQFHTSIDEPIGEYWVLSGHPSATSMITEGAFAGLSLQELIEAYPQAYLGASPQPRFPLLIKYLEASLHLSVQVHPDDAYAQVHEGDFGKTEAWYVLDAGPEKKVCYGHHFSSREDYTNAVKNADVLSHLSYRTIENGDVVYVPSGTLHALLAHTTVIEIQQTSDVTYRVYDWERVDEAGKERMLHVDAAAEVLHYTETTSNSIPVKASNQTHSRMRTRLNCPYFTIDEIVCDPLSNEDDPFTASTKQCITLKRGNIQNPDILICVHGYTELTYSADNGELATLSLSPGELILIPATLDEYELSCTLRTVLLRVYY